MLAVRFLLMGRSKLLLGLLAALVALVLTQFAARSAPELVLGDWENLYPALAAADSTVGGDVWAVGEYGHVLHYSGGRFTNVDPPQLRGASLTDIDMVDATTGWVAAGRRTFKYSGGGWVERSGGLGTGTVNRLVALRENDVWGIGYAPDLELYALQHYGGTSWTAVRQTPSDQYQLRDLAMTSASNGWSVGYLISGTLHSGLLMHWDGTNFGRIGNPDDNAPGEFFGVGTTSPNDVWISGISNTFEARLYHYNWQFGSWESWSLPGTGLPGLIDVRSASDIYIGTSQGVIHFDGSVATIEYSGRNVRALAGVGTDHWAVGFGETVLRRSSGGAWNMLRGGPAPGRLNAVYARTATDAWAVGAQGVILHYDGRSWQNVAGGMGLELTDVQFLAAANGYAAGQDGVGGKILHWNGSAWSVEAAPAAQLNSIYMRDSNNGWAVGNGGAIWRKSAGVWASFASPTTKTLHAVAQDSDTHGWAVGGDPVAGPVLLEYSGGAWIDRSSRIPPHHPVLYDIALNGVSAGLIVGTVESGYLSSMLRMNGTSVTDVPNTTLPLYSIAIYNRVYTYAVGHPGSYYVVQGTSSLRQVAFPTESDMYSISMVPNDIGWAVGANGTIMRYINSSGGPTPTRTSLPHPTITASAFSDVHPTDYFYEAVQVLNANGIISGYTDPNRCPGGAPCFQPFNNTTRSQLVKIIVLATGRKLLTPDVPTFQDVQPDNPFYGYVETAVAANIISGYADGNFRPYSNVTRAQLAKIVVTALQWDLLSPDQPTFVDVPVTDTFSQYVETAVAHGIIAGYDRSDGKREFRPGNDATRGQIAKIVYGAVSAP